LLATEYLVVKGTRSSDNKISVVRVLLFLNFIFLSFYSAAQRYEVGAAIGGGNYLGDLNPTFRPENYRLAGGVFGRYNFSQVVSTKLFVNGVQAKGSDRFYEDPYPQARGANFIRTVLEFGGQVEYNFFNYRDEKSRRKWTPYFLVGIGGMYMFDQEERSRNKANRFQPIIPTGVGFRYILGGKWNLGLELGARKTFTDYFDHLSGEDTNPKTYNGNEFDRDWYFVSTISISYTFYTIPCPFDKYN
jgi:hypothetical protein